MASVKVAVSRKPGSTTPPLPPPAMALPRVALPPPAWPQLGSGAWAALPHSWLQLLCCCWPPDSVQGQVPLRACSGACLLREPCEGNLQGCRDPWSAIGMILWAAQACRVLDVEATPLPLPPLSAAGPAEQPTDLTKCAARPASPYSHPPAPLHAAPAPMAAATRAPTVQPRPGATLRLARAPAARAAAASSTRPRASAGRDAPATGEPPLPRRRQPAAACPPAFAPPSTAGIRRSPALPQPRTAAACWRRSSWGGRWRKC